VSSDPVRGRFQRDALASSAALLPRVTLNAFLTRPCCDWRRSIRLGGER
jgi:hypothetical protein